MSFCLSSVYAPITDTKLVIEVKTTHHLIRLANALDWLQLVRLVEGDLKQSTGKFK